MESQNLLNLKKAPILPKLIKKSEQYTIIVTEYVENKIRHLCREVPDLEWSGTLFYTYEGSIEENNLIIRCEDIFVMNIGTPSYTEFDVDPSVIAYMCEHQELMSCQIGLIHSHNRLDSFFSGTDTATLREEGDKRNHFVSLIVNNAGIYTAAITRKLNIHRTNIDKCAYKTFEDKSIEIEDVTTETNLQEIEYFYLDVKKEDYVNPFLEIDERLKELRSQKNKYKVGTKFDNNKSYININDNYYNTWYDNFNNDKNCPVLLDKEDAFLETVDKNLLPSKQYVKSCTIQLLTGSIAISDESKIDTTRWSKTLPVVFGKRFEGNTEHYKIWIDTMFEFMVFYPTKSDEKKAIDEIDYASNLASQIIEELSKLPKNDYINIIIETLEKWIQ